MIKQDERRFRNEQQLLFCLPTLCQVHKLVRTFKIIIYKTILKSVELHASGTWDSDENLERLDYEVGGEDSENNL